MSCRKQSHLWGQTRLLRDLCSQILKIFNDRFCIKSLDSLYQSLSVLMQQNCTSTRFRVFLDWGHCVWHPVFCTNSISFKFFSQGIWLKLTYIITWSPSKRGGDRFLTLKLELLMYKALVPSLGGKKISFSHLNVTARIPLIAERSIKGSLTGTGDLHLFHVISQDGDTSAWLLQIPSAGTLFTPVLTSLLRDEKYMEQAEI